MSPALRATRPLLLLALLVLGVPRARAGDEEALALLEQARAAWDGPEPRKPLELLDQALAAGPERLTLRMVLELTKGRLLASRLGDPLAAEPSFDWVVQQIETMPTLKRINNLERQLARPNQTRKEQLERQLNDYRQLLQLKGQAMLGKANVVYAEHGQADRALRIYLGSQLANPDPATCDIVSQFCYRVAGEPDTPEERRPDYLRRSLSMAQRACYTARGAYSDAVLREQLPRYQLQLVIALYGAGYPAVAELAWSAIDKERLAVGTLYQQASLVIRRGEPERAAGLLRRFMEETRPVARGRNDLRKFIRTEPDFQPYLRRDDWRWLVEDEPAD